MLSHPLNSIPEPDLPAGFVIRSLAGESEVEQYVSLHRTAFDSNNMTIPWRLRTLRSPLYDPALDLVAVAPDGQLAGFCIWWYNPKLKTAQIEPMGVHPDFQHLGLSQALMFEGLRRVAAKGAEIAQVETYNFNQPALNAYQAIGFRATAQKFKYFKEY
jgi:ribosomal protein S18 acetylase RimI-like enzyme